MSASSPSAASTATQGAKTVRFANTIQEGKQRHVKQRRHEGAQPASTREGRVLLLTLPPPPASSAVATEAKRRGPRAANPKKPFVAVGRSTSIESARQRLPRGSPLGGTTEADSSSLVELLSAADLDSIVEETVFSRGGSHQSFLRGRREDRSLAESLEEVAAGPGGRTQLLSDAPRSPTVSPEDIFTSIERAVHQALRSGREELADIPDDAGDVSRPGYVSACPSRGPEQPYRGGGTGLLLSAALPGVEGDGYACDAYEQEAAERESVLRRLSDIRGRLARAKASPTLSSSSPFLPPQDCNKDPLSSSSSGDTGATSDAASAGAAAPTRRRIPRARTRSSEHHLHHYSASPAFSFCGAEPTVVEIVEAVDEANRIDRKAAAGSGGSLRGASGRTRAAATFDPAHYAIQLLHKCGPKTFPGDGDDNDLLSDGTDLAEDVAVAAGWLGEGQAGLAKGNADELEGFVKDFTRRVLQEASLGPHPAAAAATGPATVVPGVPPSEARRLLQTSSVTYNPQLAQRQQQHGPARPQRHEGRTETAQAVVPGHRKSADAESGAREKASQEALVKRVIDAIPALSPDLQMELARQRRALDHLTSIQQEHLRKLDRQMQEESRRRLQAPRVDPASGLLAEARANAPENVRLGLHKAVEPLLIAGAQVQRTAADPTQALPPLASFTQRPDIPLSLGGATGETALVVANNKLLDREARFYEKELSRLRDEYGAKLDDEQAKRKLERRAFQEVLQKQQHDMLKAHTEALRLVKRESQLAAAEHAALVHQLTVRQEAARERHGEDMQKRHEQATRSMLAGAVDVMTAARTSAVAVPPPPLPQKKGKGKGPSPTKNSLPPSPRRVNILETESGGAGDTAAGSTESSASPTPPTATTRTHTPSIAREPTPPRSASFLSSPTVAAHEAEGMEAEQREGPGAVVEASQATSPSPSSVDEERVPEGADKRRRAAVKEEGNVATRDGAGGAQAATTTTTATVAVEAEVEGGPQRGRRVAPTPTRPLAKKGGSRSPIKRAPSSAPPPPLPGTRSPIKVQLPSEDLLRQRYNLQQKQQQDAARTRPKGPALASSSSLSPYREQSKKKAGQRTSPPAQQQQQQHGQRQQATRKRKQAARSPTLTTITTAADRHAPAETARAAPPTAAVPQFLSQHTAPLAPHPDANVSPRSGGTGTLLQPGALSSLVSDAWHEEWGHGEAHHDATLSGSRSASTTTAGQPSVGRALLLLTAPSRHNASGGAGELHGTLGSPPPPAAKTFEEAVDDAYARPEVAPAAVERMDSAQTKEEEDNGKRPVPPLSTVDFFYFGEPLEGDYARRWRAYERARKAVQQLELAAAPDPGAAYKESAGVRGKGSAAPAAAVCISTQGAREGFTKEWAREEDYPREVLRPGAPDTAAADGGSQAAAGIVVSPSLAHRAQALQDARHRLLHMQELLLQPSATSVPFASAVPLSSFSPFHGRNGQPQQLQGGQRVAAHHRGFDVRQRIENEVIHSVLGEAAEAALLRQLMKDLERELVAAALQNEMENARRRGPLAESGAAAQAPPPVSPPVSEGAKTKKKHGEEEDDDDEGERALWLQSLEDAILEKLLVDPAAFFTPSPSGDEAEHGGNQVLLSAIDRAMAGGGAAVADPIAGNKEQSTPAEEAEQAPAVVAAVAATSGADGVEHVVVSVPVAPDPAWVKEAEKIAAGTRTETAATSPIAAQPAQAPARGDILDTDPADELGAVATVDIGANDVNHVPPNSSSSSGGGGNTVRVVLDVAPLLAEFQKQTRNAALSQQQQPRRLGEEEPRANVGDEDLRDVIVESVTVVRKPTPTTTTETVTAPRAAVGVEEDVAVPVPVAPTPPQEQQPAQKMSPPVAVEGAPELPTLQELREQHTVSLVRELTRAEGDRRFLVAEQEEGQRETLCALRHWALESLARRQRDEPSHETKEEAPPTPPPPPPALAEGRTKSEAAAAAADAAPPIRDPVTRFIFEWLKDYGEKEEADNVQQQFQRTRIDFVGGLNAAAATADMPLPSNEARHELGAVAGDLAARPLAAASSSSRDGSDSWLSSTNPSSYGPVGNHHFLRGPEALHIASRRALRPDEQPAAHSFDDADGGEKWKEGAGSGSGAGAAASEYAWMREAVRRRQHERGEQRRRRRPVLDARAAAAPTTSSSASAPTTTTTATTTSATSSATTRYTTMVGAGSSGRRRIAAAREGVDGYFRPHDILSHGEFGHHHHARHVSTRNNNDSSRSDTTRGTTTSLTSSASSPSVLPRLGRQRRGAGPSAAQPPQLRLNNNNNSSSAEPLHAATRGTTASPAEADSEWPLFANTAELAEMVRQAQEAARAREAQEAATSAFDGAALQHTLTPPVRALPHGQSPAEEPLQQPHQQSSSWW